MRVIALDSEPTPRPVRVLATDCGEVNTVIVVPADDDTLVVVGSGKGLRAAVAAPRHEPRP